MALTKDFKASLTSPTLAASGGISPSQPMDDAAFQQWLNPGSKPAQATPKVGDELKTPDQTGGGFSSTVNKVAGDTFAPVQEAGTKIAKTASDFANGPQTVGNAAQAGFDVAGEAAKGAVGMVTAPVNDAIKAVSDKASNNSTVQKVAGSKPVSSALDALNGASEEVKSMWSTLEKNHPVLAKNIENSGNIAQFLGLAAGEKPVTDAATKAATVATDAATTAIDATKSAATKVVDTTKTAIKDTIEENKTKVTAAEAVKNADAEKQKLTDAIEVTKPALNKKESIASFEQAGNPGGIDAKGNMKTYERTPNQRDTDVAYAVKDLVSTKKGPLENIVSINKEINRVSTDEVGKYLSEHKVPFNFEDLRGAMDLTSPESGLKADPAALQTYTRVKENLLNEVYKDLKGKANASGDFGNTTDMNDLWKARIAVDRTISRELGDATFGTPQYTGVKAAAVDFRNSMQKFIIDNLENPGQMGQVNKMGDFARQARARGIEVPTDPEGVAKLKEQFGVTGGGEADATAFKQSMDRLTKMYEARSNLAETNYKLMDKNAVQRWMKTNPGKAKLVGKGLTILGLGLGGDLILH